MLAGVGLWIALRLPPDQPGAGFGPQIIRDGRDLSWLLVLAALAIPGARILNALILGSGWSERMRLAVVLALPAGLALYFLCDRIATTKTALIGGERYFWLDDDMMISMRYARNLAHGYGLVWNPGGPHVEGYSNFLWTLVLSLPHLAGFPARLVSGEVLVINVCLAMLALLWTARVGRQLGLDPAGQWIALLLLACNRWFIYWTAGGSENILLALLLLISAEQFLRARRHHPLGLGAGMVLGMMALVRADGLALMVGFLPALVIALLRRRARPAVLLPMIAFPVLHVLGRNAYYGQWLPNTYFLKTVAVPLKEAMGSFYLFFNFFFPWMGVCVLHLLSIRLAPRLMARWLALVPWAGVAYVLLVGGDELPESRFMVPLVPLFILGAVSPGQRVFTAIQRRRSSRAAAYLSLPGSHGWLVLIFALVGAKSLLLPEAFKALGVERSAIERRNVRIGLILKENTSPDALIAHYWAGAAPYFSDRPAHDMLGKSDAVIAHEPGHAGEWEPGHTKYDTKYTMSASPDVIVTALPADLLDNRVRAWDPSCRDYPSLCALYDDPVFRGLYARGLVSDELSLSFHAIFVRGETPRAAAPDAWEEIPDQQATGP